MDINHGIAFEGTIVDVITSDYPTSVNITLNNTDVTILNTPKGTTDYSPEDMYLRDYITETIKTVFKRHGAVTIETPMFEYKHILVGKYGEDQKLIYDLDDQGALQSSLRYDLTVPFARYLATSSTPNIRRYQIGEVFRRDQPSITQGRMRQFTQCDMDIAGKYDLMLPDAEVIKIMVEILDAFGADYKLDYRIKFNHKVLLDCLLTLSNIPPDKIQTTCSSIDKLDKHDWEYVANELEKKGLTLGQIDNLREFVILNGEPMRIVNPFTAENF